MKWQSLAFLGLLVLLVGMVVFIYNTPEGFLAFDYGVDAANGLNKVVVPQYSAQPVVKLYDSVYLDSTNGNVLELFGKAWSGSNSNVDNTGVSLTHITLVGRGQSTSPATKYQSQMTHYDLSANLTVVVPTANIPPSVSKINNQAWLYPTANDLVQLGASNPNVPVYQILYIPWDQDTIVELFNIAANTTSIGTFYFRQNMDPVHILNNHSMTGLGNSAGGVPGASWNTYVTLPVYENKTKSVFQITDNVYFDPSNRYLLVTSNAGTAVTVYDGTQDSSGPIKKYTNSTSIAPGLTPTSIPAMDFESLWMSDADGGNVILYVTLSDSKTLVAVLTVDPANQNLLTVVNLVRFNPHSTTNGGIDGIPNVTGGGSGSGSGSGTSGSGTSGSGSSSDSTQSDFAKWWQDNSLNFGYYQQMMTLTGGLSTGWSSGGKLSEDYLLKTQIVPPVCPTCPNCPSATCGSGATGTCTNCGGQGGSGTVGANGGAINAPSTGLGIASGVQNVGQAAVNTGSNLGSNVISGGERVGKDVLTAAEIAGADVLLGTGLVATGVWNGAGEVVGGVKDAATAGFKEVKSDVTGIYQEGKSTVSSALSSKPTPVQNQNTNTNTNTNPNQNPTGYSVKSVSGSNSGYNPNPNNLGSNPYQYGVWVGPGFPNSSSNSNSNGSSSYMPVLNDFSRFGK